MPLPARPRRRLFVALLLFAGAVGLAWLILATTADDLVGLVCRVLGDLASPSCHAR